MALIDLMQRHRPERVPHFESSMMELAQSGWEDTSDGALILWTHPRLDYEDISGSMRRQFVHWRMAVEIQLGWELNRLDEEALPPE